MEINNQSITLRPGARENARIIIDLCKQKDVMIVAASDAHMCLNIGDVSAVTGLLKAVNFPEAQILNLKYDRFDAYIQERAKRIKAFEAQDGNNQ